MKITDDPGDVFFPYNAIFILEAHLSNMDSSLRMERRRLRYEDPDGSVGIIPVNWTGVQDELGKQESPYQVYTIFVQTLIVDTDEARGLRSHSYFAKRVRELLARSQPLLYGLGGLRTDDLDGHVSEKYLRHTIGEQVFHDDQEDGNFRYLSTIEIQLETQIQRI